jgi:tetratricopeptide (TPR) repeat protein
MSTQSNMVYLAYSQDAVRRLPATIAHGLRQYGYDVFMDTSSFTDYDNIPQSNIDEITRREHFVLVLTSATYVNGFQQHHRLSKELLHAVRTSRHVIVAQAFDFSGNNLRPSYVKRHFPAHYERAIVKIDHWQLSLRRLDRCLSKRVARHQQVSVELPFSEHEIKAEAEVEKGLVELNDGLFYNRPSNELFHFNRAIEHDPRYAPAYYQRAVITDWGLGPSAVTEDYEALIAELTRIIELDPTDARSYVLRARLSETLYRPQDALADRNIAIQLAPHSGYNYIHRGKLHLAMGEIAAAVQDFSTVIDKQLNQLKDAYLLRSQAYKQQGQLELALSDLKELAKLET